MGRSASKHHDSTGLGKYVRNMVYTRSPNPRLQIYGDGLFSIGVTWTRERQILLIGVVRSCEGKDGELGKSLEGGMAG